MSFKNIPLALRLESNWVLWKMAGRPGGLTKKPFQVSGEPAKANDPTTWTEFATVVQRFEAGGYDGIGYEFAKGGRFCGIDLDGCRDPKTGAVSQWAREIILDLDSYAEVSPTKTGVKIFVVGKSPNETGKKKPLTFEKVCSKLPAIEVYDHGRFFAVTGWRLKGPLEPQERQQQLTTLVNRFWPDEPAKPAADYHSSNAVIERARKYMTKIPPAVSGQAGHDQTFIAACRLVMGFGLSEETAMQLLTEWNQTCQPPWSERELLHKVQDASKQSGERNYLRNIQPQNWSKVRLPEYKQPEPKHEPKLTTLVDATRKYIDGLKAGKTELIELGLADVDYAIGGGVERGELVILAARPSHGKSAIALQCVHSWTLSERPCLLISEEMSARALGKRTLQFISDEPEEHWRTSVVQLGKDLDYYASKRAPTVIAESCGTTESAIEQIERSVELHKVQCVVVDYAQILRGYGKTRYEQITATSIALKQVAAKHNLIVLLLCQLSREIEKRSKFTPVMSDIKETGQLEQDADVILFSVWPHRIDASKKPEEFLFFIAKNRNRAINQTAVTCRFKPSRQMILPPSVKEKKNYTSVFDEHNNDSDFV